MIKTNYFSEVKTLEELRNKYRDLLKKNHPDNGGDVATMQAINAEYSEVFEALRAGAKIDNETTARKWSEAEDAALREALNKIIHLDGLNIEIVGCWIWIDGNTYEGRDVLKTAGYKWSRARQKWHFAPYANKYHKGKKKPFEQLREMYGSQKVETEKPGYVNSHKEPENVNK